MGFSQPGQSRGHPKRLDLLYSGTAKLESVKKVRLLIIPLRLNQRSFSPACFDHSHRTILERQHHIVFVA